MNTPPFKDRDLVLDTNLRIHWNRSGTTFHIGYHITNWLTNKYPEHFKPLNNNK